MSGNPSKPLPADPFGRLALAALIICIGSGLPLVALWDPAQAVWSLELIAAGWPLAFFARNLHWLSATALIVFAGLHLLMASLREDDLRPRLGPYSSALGLVLILPLASLSGFLMRGGAEAEAAGQVFRGLLHEIPWIGDALLTLLLGSEDHALATLGLQHVGLLTLAVLAMSLHHGKLRWPDRRSLILVNVAGVGLAGLIWLPPPLRAVAADSGSTVASLRGPWFLWGLQGLLRFWTPGWLLTAALGLTLTFAARRKLPAWGRTLVALGLGATATGYLGISFWMWAQP